MADRYAVTGQQLVVEVSPGETILNLFNPAVTPVTRAEVVYFSIGASGTMADQVQTGQAQRTTTTGTEGTGVVPAGLSDGAVTGEMDAGQDHSAEPAYTSATELWEEPIHLRALAQIQLQPDTHFKLPATQDNGLGIRTFSATYGGPANATIHFLE